MKKTLLTFRNKDQKVRKKWDEKSKHMSISSTFYTFDTKNNIKQFEEDQFENKAQLEKYKKYREEWHRRPKEFDHGKQP